MTSTTHLLCPRRTSVLLWAPGTDIQWPTYRPVGMQHAGYKILVAEDDTILGAHVVSDNPASLINTFKQAIIDGTTVEELYWQNIMSPYPSRESDIIYMLKPLVK